MYKRVSVFFLSMVLLVSLLTGCGGTDTTGGDAKTDVPKEVVIGLAGDAYSLDPFPLNETITNAINNHLYSSLVAADRNLQIEPALAED